MKQLKINTKVIASFNPCKGRFDNWKDQYSTFNGDIMELLALENITAKDKIWVAVRLLPRFLIEEFAIDCAVKTAYTADVAYAAYAADAYAREKSLEDSVDALAWLIEDARKNGLM